MEFGRLPVTELNAIDFTLPGDPALNAAVLIGKPADNFRFNLGMSRWGRTEWVGKLYPPRTKEKDFLSHYARHFNAIELNATHYKLYGENGIQKWIKLAANPDFRFCPKMYKGITHTGSPAGKEVILREFLNGTGGFSWQLGPTFIQVSDTFSPKRMDELVSLLDPLPDNQTFFVEVRHPDWFGNETVFNKLLKREIGAVITDSAGRRDCVHMHLTIPKLFVRFVSGDMHPTDKVRIRDWAERIRIWRSKGLQEVNFFIHSEDELASLEVAKMAIDMFNEICTANLKPLRLDSHTLF